MRQLRHTCHSTERVLTIISTFSLEIAEDLCRKKKPKDALPYIMKALDADPSNLDAFVQLAFLMPTLAEGIDLLKVTETKGE